MNSCSRASHETNRRFKTGAAFRSVAGAWLLMIGIGGCGPATPDEVVVVVYTDLDRELAQPILERFAEQTGIVVRPEYDIAKIRPASRTPALAAGQEIASCDVYWSNEILHTLRLESADLLRRYTSPAAARSPELAKSPDDRWCGFASQARVLIVNTNQLPESRRPESIRDLVDPQWYDRCGMAKPLRGKSATHAACLFAAWGDEQAKNYLLGVKRNVRLLSDDEQVARAVARGALAFGIVDAGDAIAQWEQDQPVAIVYPDQGDGQLGTLFLPGTLALIEGSPHPAAAERLFDYLLSRDVAHRVAAGAQFAANPDGKSNRYEMPSTVRPMEVDLGIVADKWDKVAAFLTGEFGHSHPN